MKLLRRKRVMEMACCTKNDEEYLMDQLTSFSLPDGIMSQESVMNVETTTGRIACSARTKYFLSSAACSDCRLRAGASVDPPSPLPLTAIYV